MTHAGRPFVVHVITGLTTGGAERQLQGIVARQDADVRVLALYEDGPVGAAIRASGVPVEVLGMSGARKWLAWPRLARRLRTLAPHIVHVHLLSAQLWGIPAARVARVPLVISTEHSLMSDSIEERPLTWWLRALYLVLERMSDHTIAVSDETRARLARWGVPRHRVTVIENGIDLHGSAFGAAGRARARRAWRIDDEVTVIGAVGRLSPAKRLDRLIRAAADVLGAKTQLVIAGEGGERRRLEGIADELGVREHVHFLGSCPDMRDVLSGFDVFISASQDETFGMAVLEALANGLDCAYVECPALDDVSPLPRSCHPMPRRAGDDELRVLRAGVDSLLGQRGGPGQPGRRDRGHDMPPVLRERFDLEGVARRVDAVYARQRSSAR